MTPLACACKSSRMDTTADHARRIENIIRHGTVEDIDYGTAGKSHPRIRVRSGGILSDWLPYSAGRAGTTRSWSPPTKGEQVTLLSPSGDISSATVIAGGLYQDAHRSPSHSPDEHVTEYADGAKISYNQKNGTLVATGVKTANVTASKTCRVTCPETTVDGNVTVTGNLTVKKRLTYLGGLAGMSGAGGGFAAEIVGDIKHVGGGLDSNGIILHSHTHAGVRTGNNNTKPPVPADTTGGVGA